jgi:hypothetical protein
VADVNMSNTKNRGWEGWLEWSLDDGTSICKMYGGEEVKKKKYIIRPYKV